MNDTLSTTEIKERSLTGAKWLILTNGFGMPAAYLIALILGRTGPAALGAYALAQIFIGVITTFAMFGGPAVLRNFMPKISGADQRGRFLFSYGLILAGLMPAVLTVFYFFPSLLEFLLRREFSQENYGWFVLLTVVVVGSECLIGAADGLMHIKLAAIARLMARIVILPLVAGLFLFDRSFLRDHAFETILAGFLMAYGVSVILCVIGIWHHSRLQMRFGWRLPPGFGAFAFTSTAAMVFSFLYGNFDRMCVLGLSDLKGLGMYQAVISLVMLIDFAPRMLTNAMVPMYSSLMAAGDQEDTLKRVHAFAYRNGVLLMTLIALPLIAFSREALAVFGKGYSEYYYLLCLFSFVFVVRSPFLANTPYLISSEKNVFRLCQNSFQVLVQVLGTVFFIKTYGIFAIAGSKAIANMLASLAGNTYAIHGLKIQARTPREFKAAVCVAFAVCVARVWIVPSGWASSAILSSLGVVGFWLLAGISVAEIKTVGLLLLRRQDISQE